MSLNPANVTLVSGGTANSILTVFTTNGTGLGTYQVTVTGFSPGLSRSVTLAVTVTSPPPPPDFSITVSPTNQTIHRGSTATYTITVMGMNGFNGTVTLSGTISPVNRHGPALSLPSTVGPYSTSTLTVATGHNTPQGIYTITVKATSGSLVHTFTITLNVTA
jgi:uncharacterized membrane protein